MRKLKRYTHTKYKGASSVYEKSAADTAVAFVECLRHTKGEWYGQPFDLIDWQEQIVRDVFGTLKPNGYRQFNTAYIEIPKKQGKSELAAAIALLLTCGDGEYGGEVYGCASDRQQASIVFDVAVEMVEQCPALKQRIKPILSQKRLVYKPLNSFYQVLSAEAYCMLPDTMVELSDGGRKKAADVRPGDVVLGCADTALAFGIVKSVETQPPAPIYQVTTHRGRKVCVTGNHQFLTMVRGRRPQDQTHAYHWVKAEDLRVKDRVKIALGWPGQHETDENAEEAWALGAWAGDGECGRFRFISPDAPIVERMRSFLADIGSGLRSAHSTRQKQEDKLHQAPIEHHITGNGKRRRCAGREWIRRHFGQESRARTKRIPEVILKGRPSDWAAFLAGFLDTDGFIPTLTNMAAWSSESRALLSESQALLARLGINACLNKNKLTVSGLKQLQRLDRIIGPHMSHPEKREKLRSKAEGSRYSEFNAHASDRITKIECLEPAATVSLEVDTIHTHATNGILTHNTKHGLNVHGVVFDELHAQPGRQLYDVMTHGSGDARKQPLYFLITTAGNDQHSICWEVHQKARDILDGRKLDPSFYPVIYGAKEEDDWTDPKVWRRANPSLDITVDIEKLHTACESARENPAEENLFRQLRLNQWVKQSIRWMQLEKWDACAASVDMERLRGRACYGGLDLASTTDITAFVLVFPPEGDEERYEIVPFFWIPEECLDLRVRRDHVPYDVWKQQGFLKTTEGNVTHYGFIEAFIEELGTQYDIREIAFDRWGATQMVQTLEGMGFTVVPFGQGFKDMSSPTKELMRLTLDKKLAHGGHPVLRWMMDNIHIKSDPAGNIKADKEKSTEKIDGAVATIMALDRALRHSGGGSSVYDTRGLIIF